MKKMKKLLSVVMALAMMMTLVVSASAAETGTITVQNASKGATYNFYKLFDAKVNGTGGITYNGTIPDTLTAYFTTSAGGEIVAVADADQTAMFAALKTWASTATAEETATGAGGALTVTVPYGYYVITSSIDSGAAVTVDSTNPNASVYDKNNAGVPTFPADAKEADGVTFDLGDTVTYTVRLDTVNWVGAGETAKKVTSYTIKDTATEGYLTNVTVTAIKVGNAAIDIKQFDNGEITIPWTDASGNSLYNNAAQIAITYTATVSGTGAGTNTVTATYKTGDGDTDVEKPDPSVTIYNSTIVVNKYTGDNKDDATKKLADAKFVLQNAEGKYYTIADNNVEWVETEAVANVFTTDANGAVSIEGLKDGTYNLIETVAPAGYNKLTDPTVVEVKAADATHVVSYTADVANSTGLELPSTGGIGTTIFTVVGGMLMVGAAVLFVTKKRVED